MGDMKSKFTLHTQYKDFVPGKDQREIDLEALSPHLTSAFGCFVSSLMAGLMIGVGLCSVLLLITTASTELRYRIEGRAIIAEVRLCTRITKSISLSYTYIVSGIYHHDTDSQPLPASCDTFPPGSGVPVVYLASEPSTSRIADNQDLQTAILFAAVMAFCLALGIDGFIHIRRYLHARHSRGYLATNGTLLEGEITAIKGHMPAKSPHYYVRVWYTFETPRKKILKGFAEAHRQDLKDKSLPPVGTPVIVLYVDNNTHMML